MWITGTSPSSRESRLANVVLPAPPHPSMPISRTRSSTAQVCPTRNRRSPSAACWRRCKVSEEEPKLCSVDDCDRVAVTRGWCQGHYLRWRRTGSTDDQRRLGERRNTLCEVEICDRPATTRGLCSTHYGRLKRTGRVDADRPSARDHRETSALSSPARRRRPNEVGAMATTCAGSDREPFRASDRSRGKSTLTAPLKSVIAQQ